MMKVKHLLPEGGDLVLGMHQRVAFKALDEFGKPVDFNGRIVNGAGQEITKISSYHQGMGSFDLQAQKGEKYQLEILEGHSTKV